MGPYSTKEKRKEKIWLKQLESPKKDFKTNSYLFFSTNRGGGGQVLSGKFIYFHFLNLALVVNATFKQII